MSRNKKRIESSVGETPPATGGEPAFAEAPAWREIGDGWRPLFGNFRELGFSFEWHQFQCRRSLEWSRSFHPGSLELCLNLCGRAEICNRDSTVKLEDQTVVFYFQGAPPLDADRHAAEKHQFITIEYAPAFLAKHFRANASNLHPLVRAVVQGDARISAISRVQRMATNFFSVVETLRHPPVYAPAQSVWFQSKAIELAAQLFFTPPEGELFCTRAQRAARERVEKVREIIRERICDPPQLEELGRLVGCSPCYLSRSFSQEVGLPIQQYVRQVRMERAAELLRTGACNVTEAAFAVGYSSLSHFSGAFHETFGCCPGLYPLKTPSQIKPDGPDKGRPARG